MLPRSNTRPMLTALGAVTVITLGTVALPAPALAADPAPTAGGDPAPDPSSEPPATPPPSDPPPTKTPPPATTPPYTPPSHGSSQPSLAVALSLSASTAAPGGSVTATVTVSSRTTVAHHAVLRMSAPSASVAGPGALGDLEAERSATAVVKIPAGHGAGTVSVTASLSADHASTRSASRTITVVASGAAGTSGGAAAAGLPAGLSAPNVPGVTTALGGAGQAQLPLIAGQQPAVAPGGAPRTEDVALRADTTRLGLDQASYRLLCTQVAWLAALLVGVSLLLTQLRLRRRSPVRRSGRS